MNRSIEKLQGTPCAAIRSAYANCMKSKGRVACVEFKTKLEECSAKHIGKMD